MDTAVSRAVLRAVASGSQPATLRLFHPGATVAFGPQDRTSAGYAVAIKAAQAKGFDAIQRLAGGRAAVFHEETLAFAWTVRDAEPRSRVTERFEELAEIMASAFKALGVDAIVGEVPGEYCPGSYSVNARGMTKLMGVGQRLERGAAHVGGVVVVGRSDRVRDVLIPVYEALGLAWKPETTGSLRDEVSGVSMDDAENAVLAEFAKRYLLVGVELSSEVVQSARQFESDHAIASVRATPEDLRATPGTKIAG
jgi:lipoate-protein ligase A